MNVYDFHVRQMNGKELDLSVYRGNILLIVNGQQMRIHTAV